MVKVRGRPRLGWIYDLKTPRAAERRWWILGDKFLYFPQLTVLFLGFVLNGKSKLIYDLLSFAVS